MRSAGTKAMAVTRTSRLVSEKPDAAPAPPSSGPPRAKWRASPRRAGRGGAGTGTGSAGPARSGPPARSAGVSGPGPSPEPAARPAASSVAMTRPHPSSARPVVPRRWRDASLRVEPHRDNAARIRRPGRQAHLARRCGGGCAGAPRRRRAWPQTGEVIPRGTRVGRAALSDEGEVVDREARHGVADEIEAGGVAERDDHHAAGLVGARNHGGEVDPGACPLHHDEVAGSRSELAVEDHVEPAGAGVEHEGVVAEPAEQAVDPD